MNNPISWNLFSKLLLLVFSFLFGAKTLVAQCPAGQVPVDIQITADDNAASDNTRWELVDVNDVILESGTASDIVCVPDNICLFFKIYDDFGNGYSGLPPGAYSVYYNGSLVDADINFGTDKTVDLGVCPAGSSCNFPISVAGNGTYTAPGPETWYGFVPGATGRYSFSTCNQGNSCNTTIWGYDRCDGVIDEQSQQEAVFYSDDACGDQAEVETYMIAGKTYYLRIGDSGTSCEGTAINWQLTYLGAVSGCMELNSCNYNPLATIDDGSCIYPGNPACPNGPDLIILEDVISNSLQVQNYTNNNQCYINEGCLKGYGVRQILRFTTHIQNIGNTDFFIGQTPNTPADANEQWEWDECHNHWHYEGYAEYLVFDDAGNRLPVGFKNGFCVIDLECTGGGSASYSCGNQGISHGCGDIYNSGLACQWVDLTDVPNGDYSLVVRVNWDRTPDALGRDEISYENNWAQICFNLSRNANNDAVVTEINNCSPVTDCLGELQGDAVVDCEGNCNGGRLAGDLDANDLYDINDVLAYFQGILDDNLPNSVCNDISSDGQISMLDPAMLMSCLIEENSGGGASPSCVFPYLTVDNPDEVATFSIRNTNLQDQYFDIYLQNQSASVLAFNLNLSGVTISSLQSLIPNTGFSMNLGFDASGEIAGLSLVNSSTPRYSTASPFVRVFYSAIANEACITDIVSVINDKLEVISGVVSSTNCTGVNPPPSYCSSEGGNVAYEWIAGVSLESINNNTGANGGYADFTSQVANLSAGSYPISLTGGYNSGGPYAEHWNVWIDFNVDGDFTDAGENVFSQTGNADVSGNITIPTGTGTVNTRMRVSMRWNNDPGSCEAFDYGEVEDYGIALTEVQSQTITFLPLADKLTDDVPFNIAANASSGLPVTFSLVSGPASINGNLVSLNGTPGTVVIRASQAGNINYNPAPFVEQSFAVVEAGPEDQTISFTAIPDKITTDPSFTISANASSGLPVSFSLVSGPAVVSGNTVSLTGAEGTVRIRASQNGNADYNPAPTVDRVFVVMSPMLQDQTITFAPLADKETTDPDFTLAASASSGLAVSFSLVSGPATLSGNTLSLTGTAGTVTIRASQGGNGNYNPAPNVNRSFEVTSPAAQNQTITFAALADKLTTDAAFTIAANASSGLAVSFSLVSGPASLSGNTITLSGSPGTVIIRASQSGNANYNPAADVDRSFSVIEPSTPGTYCESGGTQPWVEWIDRVTLVDIDNQTFKDQYGDYTNLSTDVVQGNAYPMDLNPGLSWSGHVTDLFWRVWIDFNQDGDFIDAGELVLEANNGKDPVSATIAIPSNASLGSTRMRVSMQKDAYAGSCDVFDYGEVEDYSVKILSGVGGPVCENITDGGMIDGNETGCDTYNPGLISSPALPSGGSGLIQYKWEFSTSSVTGPWSTATGGAITFDPATISQTTWYRRLSRRENCQVYTGVSNVVTKTVDNCTNPGTYCDAQGTQPWWEWIGDVVFGDIQNTSFKDSYGDYTGLSTDVELDGDYPISVNPGLSWGGYQTDLFWRIWIDFNQDGDFTDAGELVLEANNGRDPITSSIQIPGDATLGATRMRIAMQRDLFAGACEIFDYGEVEDYTINILPAGSPPGRVAPLLALSATKKAQLTLLEWTSNTEIQNAYFILERSVNGGDFKELLRINSQHESNGNFYYSRQDEHPVNGLLTYRVQQVHQDGSYRYSEMQEVDFSDLQEDLLLFPNPAKEEFWVKLNRYHGESGMLQIHNVYGQLIAQRKVEEWTRKGMSFDLTDYSSGVYFVSLKLNNYKILTGQLVVSE